MKRLLTLLALSAGLIAAPALHAANTTYRATLSGPSESPANPSPGTGMAAIVIDDSAMTMSVHVSFNDLLGGTTASHLHCCTADAFTGTAGVATTTPTFTDFPLGVTSGTYDHVFSLSDAASYNPAFITAHGGTVASAGAYLLSGISANEAYLNLHSSAYPDGEIRGFLVAVTQPVPEPAEWGMLLLGAAGVGLLRRRGRR